MIGRNNSNHLQPVNDELHEWLSLQLTRGLIEQLNTLIDSRQSLLRKATTMDDVCRHQGALQAFYDVLDGMGKD